MDVLGGTVRDPEAATVTESSKAGRARRPSTREQLLIQVEADFHVHLDGNRLAVSHGGFKAPLADGFNGFFVKSKAKRANDAEAGGIALGCLDQQPFAGFALQSPQTCTRWRKFLSTECGPGNEKLCRVPGLFWWDAGDRKVVPAAGVGLRSPGSARRPSPHQPRSCFFGTSLAICANMPAFFPQFSLDLPSAKRVRTLK